MTTSRRSMIKLGLFAAASFATFFEGLSGSALAAAASTTDATDDGGWLRRDMFEACIGQSFVVHTPRSGSVTLRLMRVEDVPTARTTGTVDDPDSFVVLLRGSRTSNLEQGTYSVENSTLGSFLLFLVPGQASKTGVTYAATFNRVRGQ